MRVRLTWMFADNNLTFCCLKEARVHAHNMLWHEYHYKSVFRYIKKRKR